MRYAILTITLAFGLLVPASAGAANPIGVWGLDKYQDTCNKSQSRWSSPRIDEAYTMRCRFLDDDVVGDLPRRAEKLVKRGWRCKVVRKGKTVCNRGKKKRRIRGGGDRGKRGLSMKEMVRNRRHAVQECRDFTQNFYLDNYKAWTAGSCAGVWQGGEQALRPLLSGGEPGAVAGAACRGTKTDGVTWRPHTVYTVVVCGSGPHRVIFSMITGSKTPGMRFVEDKYGDFYELVS